MTNSRRKGSVNERNVAKLLQEWSGYEFARTPQSGGLHWKKAHTSGDIVCIDDTHGKRFPYSIECKFHEELDVLHLLQGLVGKKSNKIKDFWEQCTGDAITAKKLPILFMRRNGMKANTHFVVMSYDIFKMFRWEEDIITHGLIELTVDNITLAIINSEDLIKLDYHLFYKTSKKLQRHVFPKI